VDRTAIPAWNVRFVKRVFGRSWTPPKHEVYPRVSAFCGGVERSLQSTAAFERDWREWGLGRPLHREMTFTEAGVLLGRGTLIAEFEKKGRAACGLAPET
jgi:hypothetical protein